MNRSESITVFEGDAEAASVFESLYGGGGPPDPETVESCRGRLRELGWMDVHDLARELDISVVAARKALKRTNGGGRWLWFPNRMEVGTCRNAPVWMVPPEDAAAYDNAPRRASRKSASEIVWGEARAMSGDAVFQDAVERITDRASAAASGEGSGGKKSSRALAAQIGTAIDHLAGKIGHYDDGDAPGEGREPGLWLEAQARAALLALRVYLRLVPEEGFAEVLEVLRGRGETVGAWLRRRSIEDEDGGEISTPEDERVARVGLLLSAVLTLHGDGEAHWNLVESYARSRRDPEVREDLAEVIGWICRRQATPAPARESIRGVLELRALQWTDAPAVSLPG